MRTIRIDDDVWKALQKKATAFEDTPNSVLRRLLGLDKENRRKSSASRIQRGIKTPQKAFRKPILQVLYELGGSGKITEILKRVEVVMRGTLNEIDYQTLSDGKTIRWKNTAQWERNNMVNDGLIKKRSPRGVWELTAKGVAEAEKLIGEK